MGCSQISAVRKGAIVISASIVCAVGERTHFYLTRDGKVYLTVDGKGYAVKVDN